MYMMEKGGSLCVQVDLEIFRTIYCFRGESFF